jgi:hypothetical protein
MLCPCGTYVHGGGMTKLEELKTETQPHSALLKLVADGARSIWVVQNTNVRDALDRADSAYRVWDRADKAYQAELDKEAV